jgi:hypothetical protein
MEKYVVKRSGEGKKGFIRQDQPAHFSKVTRGGNSFIVADLFLAA